MTSATTPPRSTTKRRAPVGLRGVGLLVLLGLVLTAGAPSIIRIRRGDTLSDLAVRHHTTVARLLALNHLRGNATIYAGALLRVPVYHRPWARYVVRPGDTLIGLARRTGTTVAALKAHNRLRGDRLLIGQHLRVPPRGGSATPTTIRVASPVARSAAYHRSVLATREHPSRLQVRRMVTGAARRNGVDVSFAVAVAYHESGFQQGVVSPVDAIGVMQVLPSTGRLLDRAYGRHFDLLRTSDNIEAGVRLLHQLLSATGSSSGALAGYYQGLGSLGQQGMLPQTRVYIRNVNALRPRFRAG